MKPEVIEEEIKQEFKQHQLHLATTDPQLVFLLTQMAIDIINMKEGNKWNKELRKWEEP